MGDTIYAPSIDERLDIVEKRGREFMNRFDRAKSGMTPEAQQIALGHLATAGEAMDRAARRRLQRHMVRDIGEADSAITKALAALP